MRMPPRHNRQNQTQRVPNVYERLYAGEARWRMYGQQRRHLPGLGKKRCNPNLTDSWDRIADWLGNYAFATHSGLHRDAPELGCGFADYLRILAFRGMFEEF